MEIDAVRQLVKLVEDSQIEELEVSSEGTTIRIQKSRPVAVAGPAMPMPWPMAAVPAAALPAAAAAVPAPAGAPAGAAAEERARWKEFRSPIVGTFYRSPAPGAPSFVNVGDRIAPGQTVCIIEAMKVMNEIEAEFPGVIREILVENGSPVEAEAILFLVEPA